MERVSRSKAIRLKCIDCCAGQVAEVRKCPAVDCPLWRFRMGKEENDELKPQRNNSKDNDDLCDDEYFDDI